MEKKHDGTQLLTPGHTGAKGGLVGDFLVVLDEGAGGDRDSLLCEFCYLMFESRKELGEHKIKKHKGKRVHPCSVCNKAFKFCVSFIFSFD